MGYIPMRSIVDYLELLLGIAGSSCPEVAGGACLSHRGQLKCLTGPDALCDVLISGDPLD